MTPAIEHSSWVGVSFPGVLILAIAVGFLIYVFTGSSRLVAGVLFFGLLVLLAGGFLGVLRSDVQPRRLVDLAPQRQPVNPAELGPAAATTLLGVEGRGHSFVYVLGGSPGMAEGGRRSPLLAVKEPLKRSITHLQRNHWFQVFVNVGTTGTGTCVPWERDGQSLVAADNHHVARAIEWIDALTAGTGAENPQRFAPRDELYQALALQPDVIYFVTDGKEPPPSGSELQSLQRFNTGRTALHVIQLIVEGQGGKPPKWLPELANGHRGTFKQVALAPPTAEKEPAKQASPRAEAVADATPAKRPDWLVRPPQPLERTGPDSYRAVVSSGFSKGEDRCRENFDRQLLAMATEYIDLVVEPGAGRRVTQTPGVRERALQYLSTNVIKERYREERQEEQPIDEGIEQHALLEFKPQAAEYFRQEWRMILQERGLFLFAGAVAVLLGLVGTIFGYLKTDTATRGYYSGRLRLATGVMIIGLIASAVALFMHG